MACSCQHLRCTCTVSGSDWKINNRYLNRSAVCLHKLQIYPNRIPVDEESIHQNEIRSSKGSDQCAKVIGQKFLYTSARSTSIAFQWTKSREGGGELLATSRRPCSESEAKWKAENADKIGEINPGC